jgi:D-lactate dehydrogenase (cytochrome)
MATDVCVPRSRFAECIMETQADVKNTFLPALFVGHVGDGNFNLNFVLDPSYPKELAEAKRLNTQLGERALSMDGTCMGEHGVGYGKIDFMVVEHGEAINVMRAIKRSLDPHDIMNPGKIIDVADGAQHGL